MKSFLIITLFLFNSFLFSQLNPSVSESTQITENIYLEADYIPEYYSLEFNSNPYQEDFSGTTTMGFKTTAQTNRIKLNAEENLSITSVEYHGSSISSYSRDGNVLKIDLPEILPENQTDSISVSFSGNVTTSEGYYIKEHDGVPVSYTLSEPFHAASWWVSKDDLLEKVNQFDVYITHPSEFKAGSIGKLISVTDLENGESLTHWRHSYPIPAYLMGIAVTNYAEYNNSVNVGGIEVPIINYIFPEELNEWTYSLDRIPYFIEFLSEKFGDYPFKDEKYGHAQTKSTGGMEHTTMSFMGNFYFDLAAHELAHQWFGNKVTCATWHDIWINEAFADYCVALLRRDVKGEQSYWNWKQNRVQDIVVLNWGSVYNPEADNENRIFDNRLTYKKGSMVVHLIRYILDDDELFFQALKDFLDNPEYSFGYADTQDFKHSLENSTGRNWDEFFEDWIYGEGYPIFNLNVSTSPDNNHVKLTINQTQSHPSVDFFEMPFEIEFNGSGGQSAIRKFNLTENNQVFHVDDLPFHVNDYFFNPNYDVICRVETQELNNEEIKREESSIKIYPNPAKDLFKIESSERLKRVKVYDMLGKLVFDSKTPSVRSFEIKTASWAPGTYIVQAETIKGIENLKILIK